MKFKFCNIIKITVISYSPAKTIIWVMIFWVSKDFKQHFYSFRSLLNLKVLSSSQAASSFCKT